MNRVSTTDSNDSFLYVKIAFLYWKKVHFFADEEKETGICNTQYWDLKTKKEHYNAVYSGQFMQVISSGCYGVVITFSRSELKLAKKII